LPHLVRSGLGIIRQQAYSDNILFDKITARGNDDVPRFGLDIWG
jgi:hypothetical protein